MLNKILIFFLIFNSYVFSNEKIPSSQLRLIGSIYTAHPSSNDVYNSKTNLLALEYRPVENFGVYLGHFKNSFYNDSYVLGVGKYLRPFKDLDNFYFTVGAGIVKGYEKVNYIYDKETKKVIKKSKFNTNIGGDFIVGGSVGIGYDITDYLSVDISYVGAFISTVSLKLY